MELPDFIDRHVALPCAQILEVGCGDGELAKALTYQGHSVTAIDPHAPSGPIFRQIPLEQFDEPITFDAVVANRSLHHLHDLEAALKKIESLLSQDGVLILNEFAWDQLDESTADWYLSHAHATTPRVSSLLPENFPKMWLAEHDGLHTSSDMKEQLEANFATELLEWAPYISRYYLDRIDLESEEAAAIAAGLIKAVGFRYVGSKLKRAYPDG